MKDCRFFNGKSGISYPTQFEESVGKGLQQQPITGNSNMAAKSGSTYVSGIMTYMYSVETPMEKRHFRP